MLKKRIRIPPSAIACVLIPLAAWTASGQGRASTRSVPVRGVVFDSVRGRPLRDAFVTIVGVSQTTTTDERGHFHFDSVPDGMRTFAVQHASLDSLGFSGLSARANVAAGAGEISVAVPSFATLWRNACGGTSVPNDSGLIYGTIRDARTKKTVGGAKVHLEWLDLAVSKTKKKVVGRQWTADTKSAATGDYAICGVPNDVSLELIASTDSARTGTIEIPMSLLRIQRRDLYVASSTGRGLVVGTVTDALGTPFPDVRVTLDDSAETHSDYDGAFVFRNTLTGSRRIEARFIGASSVVAVVNIAPGDTTNVALTMPRITTLSTVHVMSPERAAMLREEWEERKIMYHRHMIDSLVIGKLPSMANAFQGLPNVTVRRSMNGDFNVFVPDGRGGSCVPELRVDGAPVNDFAHLASLPPNRVVGIEVYAHSFDVPAEFLRGGVQYRCGLVAVWTKWAFRLP